mgnify:CR=1 FL=1
MSVEPHLNDPQYRVALRRLQEGEWEAGLAALAQLAERYPLDHTLRAVSQEMQLRARIDQDEREDHWLERRRRTRTLTVRLLSALVVIGLVSWGVRSYSAAAQQQLAVARASLDRQVQAAELNNQFSNAEAFLRAGRPAEARELLDKIAVVDPNFPGLQAAFTKVEAATSLDTQYAEAIALIGQQDWQAALPILKEIESLAPYYKDVSLQIANAEKQILLYDMLNEADTRYTAKAWIEAAAAYESVRALDSAYTTELVEERLFTSYVNSARLALIDKPDSLEALRTAEGYFRKALALRPQNPEIKTERELAGLYLKAQQDFTAGLWTDVITGLEILYSQDPEYARGTTRQTLYEAYVARGDDAMVKNAYDAALSDYDKALALAEDDKEAVLRLYEANVKSGDAQGAQGNYEAAVQLYSAAVEAGGLRQRAQENPTLETLLNQAEDFAARGNFSLAYNRYRRAIHNPNPVQFSGATTTHVVAPGEYLTLIASRYRSTLQAIIAANNISDPNVIAAGQQLVIPVLP